MHKDTVTIAVRPKGPVRRRCGADGGRVHTRRWFHGRGEYVPDHVHTNGIESLKRA